MSRKAISLPESDLLRELFDYDPDTGKLFRKSGQKWRGNVRREIVCNSRGYITVRLGIKAYAVHRIIWKIVTGLDPDNDIDHRDGDRSNNRWGNLRAATFSENSQNMAKHIDNQSGYVGVSWHKGSQKWFAQIYAKGAKRYLGLHETKEAAYAAYLEAKARLHEFQPIPRAENAGKPQMTATGT